MTNKCKGDEGNVQEDKKSDLKIGNDFINWSEREVSGVEQHGIIA